MQIEKSRDRRAYLKESALPVIFTAHCKFPVGGGITKKFYLCDMVKHKEKIEDPLKLLLPGAIYDYFELVHSDVSDIDVHLFLDEPYLHSS